MRTLRISTAANVVIFMVDSSDHRSGKTGLTLTLTISKDGGSFFSVTPTVTELTNGFYKVAFTASQTDTFGELVLYATSAGADPTREWYDVHEVAQNVTGVPIVDIGYSLGVVVSNFDGTAQAGAASTITLDSSTPTGVDNIFAGRAITITGGTGEGQSRRIISYVDSTKIATIYPAWATTPSSSSTYIIGDITGALADEAMTALTSVPGITDTALNALSWLFTLTRNKITQTSSIQKVFKDDSTTQIGTAPVSDDSITYTRTKWS